MTLAVGTRRLWTAVVALCLREGADNAPYVRTLSKAVRRVVDVDVLREDVRLGCLLSVMHASVFFTQGNNVRKKNEDSQRNVVVGLQQIAAPLRVPVPSVP